MKRIGKALLFLAFVPLAAEAQINTDRVMLMGRNALFYEDYVLSIQRFNMVINAKPYLAEPYFFRALAKFYLEDYTGAASDCSEAIERNPFEPDNYKLRGLCRINLKDFEGAVDDYTNLLDIDPKEETGWHNLALCYIQLKDYDNAIKAVNQMIRFWPANPRNYIVKAQAYFEQKDTLNAMSAVEACIKVDSHNAEAWSMKASVAMNRKDYQEAENALDKAIQRKPKESGFYVNRALARYYQQNLRGAMDDYDAALEMDPNNYVGHFNRGLLRAHVGDDNRAIEDFDFVLNLEPDNMIALFNRALMLDNTGDYKGAIRDITKVIDEYPNFWTGYQYRASIRRKIGDIKGAELDEFKVLKAQMDMRYSGKKAAVKTRKKSSKNIEDYNKLVEEDHQDSVIQYKSEYRGRVQDRRTDLKPQGFYILTYSPEYSEFSQKIYFADLEKLNKANTSSGVVSISIKEESLDEAGIKKHFAIVAECDARIQNNPDDANAYFRKSLSEYMVRDFEKALEDADRAIQLDPNMLLAYCLRIQIRMKQSEIEYISSADNKTASTSEDKKTSASEMKIDPDFKLLDYRKMLDDCHMALSLNSGIGWIYYNQGNIQLAMKNYSEAVKCYTKAIEIMPQLAEAYYNRGVAYVILGKNEQAVSDLSRAGEMGLYSAYNLIKRYQPKLSE